VKGRHRAVTGVRRKRSGGVWGEEEEGKCGRNVQSRDGCRMGNVKKGK